MSKGQAMKSASDRLRQLLSRRPDNAKVVYLSGLVAEKSGDTESALGHYKRAAELLLSDLQTRRESK